VLGSIPHSGGRTSGHSLGVEYFDCIAAGNFSQYIVGVIDPMLEPLLPKLQRL
jgi:hypothetical protein